jgi:hypothetical protein
MSWTITGTQKNKGLLDEFSGAAAAYSLRDLSLLRNAPVVRVRRDNDDAEQDFTATEVSDGTLAAWVGAGNNGFVRTWYDQSGNSSDVTQSSYGLQPQIVDNGSVITENSKPAIYFNDSLLGSTGLIDVTQDLSMFTVISPQTNPATQDGAWGQFSSELNSLYNYVAYGFRSGGYFTRIQTTPTTVVANGFDTTSQSQSLVSDVVKWSTLTNTFTVNGIVGNDPNLGRSTTSVVSIALGARPVADDFTYINLQEVVLYPSDQSANRAAIEANINAHYSIF